MKPMRFGPRREAGTMNKTEAQYAQHLELMKRDGKIIFYQYEGITLHLAKKTSYRPDFVVQLPDGIIEMHEVKGYWQDDARVKIKVAASIWPMVFRAVTKTKTGWQYEEIGA